MFGKQRGGIDTGRTSLPKKTTEIIVGGGNEYVIQVKANQPKLLEGIHQICDIEIPVDTNETIEKNRGRTVKRETKLYVVTKGMDQKWVGLKRIIKMTRSGTRKGKEFKEVHFYISSKNENDASYFAKGIRSHWGIENRLHWVKDKIMNEDNSRIKSPSIASNLSLIRAGVITAFRLNNLPSITQAIEKYTNKIEECLCLIGKNIYVNNRTV